jgi:hypothetical protein
MLITGLPGSELEVDCSVCDAKTLTYEDGHVGSLSATLHRPLMLIIGLAGAELEVDCSACDAKTLTCEVGGAPCGDDKGNQVTTAIVGVRHEQEQGYCCRGAKPATK